MTSVPCCCAGACGGHDDLCTSGATDLTGWSCGSSGWFCPACSRAGDVAVRRAKIVATLDGEWVSSSQFAMPGDVHDERCRAMFLAALERMKTDVRRVRPFPKAPAPKPPVLPTLTFPAPVPPHMHRRVAAADTMRWLASLPQRRAFRGFILLTFLLWPMEKGLSYFGLGEGILGFSSSEVLSLRAAIDLAGTGFSVGFGLFALGSFWQRLRALRRQHDASL